MPLYDFQCRACQATYEARAPLGELAACPECASVDVERVLSGFAGPFSGRPRGQAAKRSDDSRRVREEQRAEAKAERQRQRKNS